MLSIFGLTLSLLFSLSGSHFQLLSPPFSVSPLRLPQPHLPAEKLESKMVSLPLRETATTDCDSLWAPCAFTPAP